MAQQHDGDVGGLVEDAGDFLDLVVLALEDVAGADDLEVDLECFAGWFDLVVEVESGVSVVEVF